MSYAGAAALQAAVYQLLVVDAALAALVGAAIYDEPPPGPLSGTYVSLGPGEVRDASDGTGSVAEHRFIVSVVSDAEGFADAKAAAGAVADALLGASPAPALARGRVVLLGFLRARERRVRAGLQRRIDLSFRAIVEDD